MAILIGIDEAGYGPNLGPLVVGASAWRGLEVGDQRSVEHGGAVAGEVADLYEVLEGVVSSAAAEGRIAIADSKALYKPRGGLRLLERAVLVGLGVVRTDEFVSDWQTLWEACGADDDSLRDALPWYAEYNRVLPVDAEVEELAELRQFFCEGCESADVELLDLRARAVFPGEFNELTEQQGTKGAALSHISIGLLKTVLENLPPALQPPATIPFDITFDKHGGRNRYGALLQHHFPDEWIETVRESREASVYRWGPKESRVTVTFRTKGESVLPTALASMVAKYLRELAMEAFNAYWADKVEGLRSTAGYPQDAKRFKAEIAAKQCELGIDDWVMWRNR